MRSFLAALQFLTILPIKIKPQISREELGKSLLWFPSVGALIGFILGLSALLFSFLPQIAIACLILIESVIITGGMHLDGFADTCDGLYGFTNKEKALNIMQESRIGSMAAIGVTLLLLLKFSLFASIEKEILWRYLIAMMSFSRWAQVLSCFLFKYAREEGKAKCFIEYADKRKLSVSAIFVFGLFLLFFGVKGPVLFLAPLVPVWIAANYINKKIGGMTGDTIGAVNEIAEVGVLLFALILGK